MHCPAMTCASHPSSTTNVISNSEEFLRTLLEAEIASRDASNAAARPRGSSSRAFRSPRPSKLDVAQSSVPRATFDYLASLESIIARGNLCLVDQARTSKSRPLVALGHEAAARAGGYATSTRHH